MATATGIADMSPSKNRGAIKIFEAVARLEKDKEAVLKTMLHHATAMILHPRNPAQDLLDYSLRFWKAAYKLEGIGSTEKALVIDSMEKADARLTASTLDSDKMRAQRIRTEKIALQ